MALGFIGDIFDDVSETLFGDQGRGAAETAAQENVLSREFIREGVGQGRTDIGSIFPSIEQNQLLGAQGALDVFGRVVPQQVDLLQQGNVAAQNRLAQGLPQIQNALLGLPTDLGFTRNARKFNFDPSRIQQRLPNFQRLPTIGPIPGGSTAGAPIPEAKSITDLFDPLGIF